MPDLHQLRNDVLREILQQRDRYTSKLVVAGDHIELYQYARPIIRGTRPERRNEAGSVKVDVSDTETRVRDTVRQKRADNLQRSRRQAKLLVFQNMRTGAPVAGRCDLWLTLTYANDSEALPSMRAKVLRHVARFQERFSAKYPNAGYLYVLELQDGAHYTRRGIDKVARNVLHAHMLVFNAPKVHNDYIAALWGHGFTWTTWCEGSKQEIVRRANYIAKYVGKAPVAAVDEKGFVAAHGLQAPMIIRDDSKVYRELRKLAHKVRYTSTHPLFNRDGVQWNVLTYTLLQDADMPAPRWANAKAGTSAGVAIPLQNVSADT